MAIFQPVKISYLSLVCVDLLLGSEDHCDVALDPSVDLGVSSRRSLLGVLVDHFLHHLLETEWSADVVVGTSRR